MERSVPPVIDPVTLDAIPVPIVVVSADGRVDGCNGAFTRAFGWAAAELRGRAFAELRADDGAPDLQPAALRTAGGEVCEVDVSAGAGGTLVVLDAGRRRAEARAFVRDISDRQVAAAEVARRLEMQEQFALIEASVPGAIYSVRLRPDGTAAIPYASSSWGRLVGTHDERPDPAAVKALIHPEDLARITESAMRSAELVEPWNEVFRLTHAERGERWLECHAMPRREADGTTLWVGYAADVTERRELATRLQQSQKMEALGQLAGGVAHDFNNLLLLITGYCDCLLEDGVGEVFVPMVNEIQAAAKRAGNLTRQLLAFSRRQATQPKVLDLDEVVSGTLEMLRRILGEHITLRHLGSSRPLSVFADAGMLDQVVLNLAVNARNAMPNGGTLVIEVSAVELQSGAPRCGTWAQLRVCDSGEGIPPGVLPHIFEPFFTTRRGSKGTGLGLATVYGIVEQHQGWIDVASRPGEGAEFRVFLPLLAQAATAEQQAPAVAAVRGGDERILLVEDEGAVRQFLHLALERLGYQVVAVADGASAKKTWQEQQGRFDLVVTDLVMPGGLSGLELGQHLQRARPDLPVLFLSGYSPEMTGVPVKGGAFLSKPCSPSVLGARVRRLLDGAR